MKPSEILKYYLNDEIISKLLNCKDRECAVRYGESFGKRPSYFQYKGDIENAIKTGATSFHVSEERWFNPLELSKDTPKEKLNDLRKGWDLLIDIDCKEFEISKLFCNLVVNKLEREGLRSISVKFSGGSGFHILVPYETFPGSVNGVETNRLFPDAPMTISIFLKNELKNPLKSLLEKDYGIKKLALMFHKDEEKLYSAGEFDPWSVIDIDTVLISERHMFRMQYSLNEKKWLVSVPVEKHSIEKFRLDSATPGSIDTKLDFFNLSPSKNEAAGLFIRAYDKYEPKNEADAGVIATKKDFEIRKIPLNTDYLPPCIKAISAGLQDGRKRSVFILTNFYRAIGKTNEEIKQLLVEWNKKNKPPLKENLILQQINYAFGGKAYPPPNCDAPGYYKYFNVCFPDETCKLIKNPISYYFKRASVASKFKHKPPLQKKKEAIFKRDA